MKRILTIQSSLYKLLPSSPVGYFGLCLTSLMLFAYTLAQSNEAPTALEVCIMISNTNPRALEK